MSLSAHTHTLMFMRGGCSDGPVAVNNVRRGRSRWFHTNIKSIPDRQLADEMELGIEGLAVVAFDNERDQQLRHQEKCALGDGSFVYRSLAAFPETREGGGGVGGGGRATVPSVVSLVYVNSNSKLYSALKRKPDCNFYINSQSANSKASHEYS